MTNKILRILSIVIAILMISFCAVSCNKVDDLADSTDTQNTDSKDYLDTESATEENTSKPEEQVNKDYVIEKDGFSLVCKDGESYILLHKEYETSQIVEGGIELQPAVCFDSIPQFIDTVRNADFSEEQLQIISKFRKSEDGKVLIFDVNNIYYPTINGEMIDNDLVNILDIHWTGVDYGYDFLYNGFVMDPCFIDLEKYEEMINRNYSDDFIFEDGKYTCEFENIFGMRYRVERYTLTDEPQTIIIEKWYCTYNRNTDTYFSDNFPEIIQVYYRQGDQCYYYRCGVYIHADVESLTELPDEVWLSFGMEKYIPPEEDIQPEDITE